MSNLILDPKAVKVQNVVKYTGVGLVAVAASGFVIVSGASVVVAGLTAIAGIAMVNLVPVVARSLALWKQRSLTALTEVFSEETIREDELKEFERVKVLEKQYITSRSELEGAQDELRKQVKDSTPEEAVMLQEQIDAMEKVILDTELALKTRKDDLIELQRVNKLYIALHRSAAAMEKIQGAQRNVEEIQRVETARNSIKTKMRAAMAGKTVEQMDAVNKTNVSYDLIKVKGTSK